MPIHTVFVFKVFGSQALLVVCTYGQCGWMIMCYALYNSDKILAHCIIQQCDFDFKLLYDICGFDCV